MTLPLNAIFSQHWWRKAVCFECKMKYLLYDRMDIQSNPEQRQWTLRNKDDEQSWWTFLTSEFEIYLQWNTLVFSSQSTRQKLQSEGCDSCSPLRSARSTEQIPSFLAFQHCLWLPASLHHHRPAKGCYRQQSLKRHICRNHSSTPRLSSVGFFWGKYQSHLISVAIFLFVLTLQDSAAIPSQCLGHKLPEFKILPLDVKKVFAWFFTFVIFWRIYLGKPTELWKWNPLWARNTTDGYYVTWYSFWARDLYFCLFSDAFFSFMFRVLFPPWNISTSVLTSVSQKLCCYLSGFYCRLLQILPKFD